MANYAETTLTLMSSAIISQKSKDNPQDRKSKQSINPFKTSNAHLHDLDFTQGIVPKVQGHILFLIIDSHLHL